MASSPSLLFRSGAEKSQAQKKHPARFPPGLHGPLLLQGSDLLGVHWQCGGVDDPGLPAVVREL